MNDIDALEKLVLDDNFQELSRILKSRPPNIFRILGLTHDEVRWSAFLAWLLDPNEDHGLGDKFLRNFLLDVQPDIVRTMGFSDVIVRTEEFFSEEGRGDITIRCRGDGDKLLCVIENKVRSSEGLDQTKRYFEAGKRIQKEENFNKPIYIFLTLHGEQPKCEAFISYSYVDLVKVLKQMAVQASYTSDRTLALIRQFWQNVEEVLDVGIDNEVRDKCRKIYTQHKEAVEMLAQQRPTKQMFFQAVFDSIKKEEKNFGSGFHLYIDSEGMSLTPVGWLRIREKNYSFINYSFIKSSKHTVVLRLWISEDLPDDSEKKLRNILEECASRRFDGLPYIQLDHESPLWKMADKDTGIRFPEDFSKWSKEVESVKDKFQKFLEVFPIKKIEEVPGVKG